MGLVLLDLTFRVEKAFKIRMPKDWPARLGIHERDDDATLMQFHDFILRLCRDQSAVAPVDSWQVLLRVVEDTTGADTDDLSPTTCLRKDIAPYG